MVDLKCWQCVCPSKYLWMDGWLVGRFGPNKMITSLTHLLFTLQCSLLPVQKPTKNPNAGLRASKEISMEWKPESQTSKCWNSVNGICWRDLGDNLGSAHTAWWYAVPQTMQQLKMHLPYAYISTHIPIPNPNPLAAFCISFCSGLVNWNWFQIQVHYPIVSSVACIHYISRISRFVSMFCLDFVQFSHNCSRHSHGMSN